MRRTVVSGLLLGYSVELEHVYDLCEGESSSEMLIGC